MTDLAVRDQTIGAQPLIVGDEQWRHRMLVPVLLAIGMVVALVSSLGSPMVPTVSREYGISIGDAQWTLTISLLAGATLTPVLGRLGDGRRRREVILTALGMIAVGGVLAAIPGEYWLLLCGRLLQGAGLGLMPLAMAVARDHLPEARTGPTVAMLSITTAAGVGLGYPVSAVSAEIIGYHPTFLLAAGMAILGFFGAYLTIPPSTHCTHQRLDVLGAVLLAAGVAGVVVSLSEMNAWGTGSASFLGMFGGSMALLAAWVAHERRIDNPLVNLATLSSGAVRVAQLSAVLAGFAMYLLISMVVRLVQTPASTGYGLGRSVIAAGFLLLPFSVASLATNRLLPVLRRWPGEQWTMTIGCLAFMAAMLMFAIARSELWHIVVVMSLAGIGVGTVFASMPRMIVGAVGGSETGSSLGFNQVLRTIGFSVGSAVSASILAAQTHAGSAFPESSGYTWCALLSIGMWVVTLVVSRPQGSLVVPLTPEQAAALEELERESVDAEVAGALIFELHPDAPEADPR